jgi:hypothetical protein
MNSSEWNDIKLLGEPRKYKHYTNTTLLLYTYIACLTIYAVVSIPLHISLATSVSGVPATEIEQVIR